MVFFGTRMKQDYQDDSSFSSWYPIKTEHLSAAFASALNSDASDESACTNAHVMLARSCDLN